MNGLDGTDSVTYTTNTLPRRSASRSTAPATTATALGGTDNIGDDGE